MSAEERQKFLANKTESDGSSKRNILPGATAHTYGGYAAGGYDLGEPTWKTKVKKYKWPIIIGVAVFLIALILGLTLRKKSGGDTPVPPAPPTPVFYNPYVVDDSTKVTNVNTVSGVLRASASEIERLNRQEAPLQNVQHGALNADPRLIPTGPNNQLISNIAFEIGQADYNVAYVTLTDADNMRYSIPENMANKLSPSGTMRLDMCGFELLENPFGFQFVKDTTNTLLTTKNSAFIMYDKYIQMDMQLPSRRIFGLGERNREFLLEQGTWTMWANGQESPYDDGSGGLQTYGVHPFVLVQTAVKGEYMGIYFRNSNAMSPVITYTGTDSSTFSYITTGGQLEMYLMFNGAPKDIIKQYHKIIGKPVLPPFWSLGWHAAAYAYTDQTQVQANIDNYASAGIPLEGIWLDIEYMNGYADFTVNTTAFPSLNTTFTTALKAANQKLIPIVDVGLSSEDATNTYYSQAVQNNLLIASSVNPEDQGGFLTQHVWANHTVFLDFFNEGTKEIWAAGLNELYKLVPFDGLWLDMNEATGFCNGECPDGVIPNITEQVGAFLEEDLNENIANYTWWYGYDQQQNISTYMIPFIPGGKWNLDNMSMSLNATHPSTNDTQYNTHSLYAHSEGKATREILLNATVSPLPDKRTFLLSRSTFAGSGQYVQHWLGDNHGTWEDMKRSIAGVMNFNMFGIPMVGPDTCGFFSTAGNDDLCARWIQLATFYPFARQHRDINAPSNEPWNMPEPYQTWAKNALYDRLQYVRNMYTCMFGLTQDGGSCFDPLFFHYPDLDAAFTDTEHTFIAGDALKVSPVLEKDVTTIQSYFPNGQWVSMKNWTDVLMVNDTSGGAMQTLTAPNDTVNVHLMPGKLILYQDNRDQQFKVTTDIMNNGKIDIVVNRDTNGHATGKAFLDHGETLTELNDKTYEYYEFRLNGKSLTKWNLNEAVSTSSGFGLDKLIITNANQTDHDLSDTNFACYMDNTGTITQLTHTFDSGNNTLNVTSTNGTPIPFFDLKDIHFGNSALDINICATSSQYYRTKSGDLPDLTSNTVTVELVSATPQALRDLNLTFSILESGNLNIKWSYSDNTGVKVPFEVPTDIIDVDRTKLKAAAVLSDYITPTQETTGPLTLDVMNAGTNVWSLSGFILGEYMNIIDSVAHTNPTNYKGIMGLGEQVSSDLFLPDGVFSLWSRDAADPVQSGTFPSTNMYGTHPMYMAKATDNTWFGVYTNLAAAQDWFVTNDATTGDVTLKTMAVGGVGDIFFMFGATPDAVVTQYHMIVGKPVLTPQWALGWHQCKWGYTDIDMLKQVVQNYTDNILPFNTMWSDIDYMNNYEDFTFDPVNFAGLGDWVNTIKAQNISYVPIIDAGIAQRKGGSYEPYNDGVTSDVFIKDSQGDIFTGKVWPDDAAFPDFFNPATSVWWSKWLADFQSKVAFDGVWLDMNEASNFCNGVCYDSQKSSMPVKDQLMYTPTGRDLETKSMPLDAVHMGDVTELDAHSLFGTMEVKATHDYFQSNNKRTMIIERSSFAGMGKFGSRWLGDNFSRKEYMGYSVTGIMAQNILGMPLAGADICGFIENTTPELCARWYILGAFYPFSRNHNNWGNEPQEPWMFKGIPYDQSTSYYDIIQFAMRTKMSMIKYYHTQLTLLHMNGGTFFKPLFFEFPDDAGAITASQELNIMLGSALKLSVQSAALDTNSTDFYFPAGTWCDVFRNMTTTGCMTITAGQETKTLSTLAYEFYLHLREGYIVPMQDGVNLNKYSNITTTANLQTEPIDLHVLPTCNATFCVSSGDYINDNGLDNTLSMNMNQYSISYVQSIAAPNVLSLAVSQVEAATNYANNQTNANDALRTIQIYNAQSMAIGTGNYTVVATMTDDTTQTLDDAEYITVNDRLVFQYMDNVNRFWLTNVKLFTLTKI